MQMPGPEGEGEERRREGGESGREGGREAGGAIHQNKTGTSFKCGPIVSAFLRLFLSSATFP